MRPLPFTRMLGAPQKQRTKAVHLSAPVGGINTVAPASAMDATDCLYLFNLIPFQYGLRVRSGWREWCTSVGTSTPLPDLYQDCSPLMFYLAGSLGGARIGAWTGVESPGVRSLLSFSGSTSDGENDRLWACTKEGIWDVTNTTSTPTKVYAFPLPFQTFQAGKGVGTAFTNVAGEHMYAYCDGANGYLLYRESTGTWTKIIETPTTAWAAATAYTVGNLIVNYGLAFICTQSGTSQAKWAPSTAYVVGDKRANGPNLYEVITGKAPATAWLPNTAYVLNDERANGPNLYRCITAGTSAAAGGPTGTAASIDDNTAKWMYVSVAPGTSDVSGGPSGYDAVIADGGVTWKFVEPAGPHAGASAIDDGTAIWDYYPSIAGANPDEFRFVMSWKNRLWFVIGDTAEACYLPVGQFAGAIDNNDVQAGGTINFGSRFRYGGNLVGLWNWTVDGGVGIDDHLVGISSAGDVVIYTGTDPALPGEFGLKGVWWVGPVPPGRKIASAFGGDLFILALIGCVPLSKLVAGYMIRDPNIYATAKIANLFNIMMTERGATEGWEINMHPTDNLLVIMVPATPGKVQEQLCMSMASKGWSRSVGVPMTTMETWHGKLFFGTADSRVCIHDGVVDGMTLDAVTNWPIDFALLTSFQSLGSSQKKRIHMIRPLFMTDGTVPGYETQSRWDFDISMIEAMPIIGDLLESSVWNQGVWNRNKWDDGVDRAGQYYGSTGLGTHAAIVLQGTAATQTTFIGFDVAVDQGGIL